MHDFVACFMTMFAQFMLKTAKSSKNFDHIYHCYLSFQTFENLHRFKVMRVFPRIFRITEMCKRAMSEISYHQALLSYKFLWNATMRKYLITLWSEAKKILWNIIKNNYAQFERLRWEILCLSLKLITLLSLSNKWK